MCRIIAVVFVILLGAATRPARADVLGASFDLAVGGAFAIHGIVTIVRGRRPARRARLVPAPLRGGAGLFVMGRF